MIDTYRVTPDIEVRASHAPATESQLADVLARIGSGGAPDLHRTAAHEVAAGMLSRAFALLQVRPLTAVTRAVTPDLLALFGRQLIERGEALAVLEVMAGRVKLLPASGFDIHGGPDPDSWMYRLDVSGPSQVRTVRRESASVVHIRINADPRRPWRGRSPIEGAKDTANLFGRAERSLADETKIPSARIAPRPGRDPDHTYLGKLIAGGVLAPQTNMSFLDGKNQEPARFWEPQTMGPEPKDSLVALRSDVGREVLTACGIPPDLFQKSEGAGQREAWRRFVLGTVQPLARIAAAELAAKLDVPELELLSAELYGADLVSRSRALGSMVKAGVGLDDALRLAGLDSE